MGLSGRFLEDTEAVCVWCQPAVGWALIVKQIEATWGEMEGFTTSPLCHPVTESEDSTSEETVKARGLNGVQHSRKFDKSCQM